MEDKNLFLLQFNVKKNSENVDELADLLTQLKALPNVVVITETKLQPYQLYTNQSLESYIFIHSDSEKNSGEVDFYIKNSFKYQYCNC